MCQLIFLAQDGSNYSLHTDKSLPNDIRLNTAIKISKNPMIHQACFI